MGSVGIDLAVRDSPWWLVETCVHRTGTPDDSDDTPKGIVELR